MFKIYQLIDEVERLQEDNRTATRNDATKTKLLQDEVISTKKGLTKKSDQEQHMGYNMINTWDSTIFDNFKENNEVAGTDMKRVVRAA